MSHKLEHSLANARTPPFASARSAPLSAGEFSQAKLFPQRREVRRRLKRRSPTRLRPLPRGASPRRWAAPPRRRSADMGFRGLLRFCSARPLPHGP